MPVTQEQLCVCYPNLKPILASKYLPDLNRAMAEASINTPLRVAAFLAQVGHESGQLRYWEEIASGKAYEGRADLGNTQPGDGVRYKGRGPIQLTGRRNYRAAGQALGLDLENDPERAAHLDVGFRTACWFWKKNGLNVLADQCADDPSAFDRVTRRINGGLNGKADRDQLFAKSKKVLGA